MEKTENKKKILVVDDNIDLNKVLVDKLSAHGFDAIGAFDGEDGLKKALEEHPNLILLDVLMPKMNGFDMLGKLRMDEWGKDVRVIMLTVIDDENNISQGVDKNIYGYLIKTELKLDEIIEQVEQAMKN